MTPEGLFLQRNSVILQPDLVFPTSSQYAAKSVKTAAQKTSSTRQSATQTQKNLQQLYLFEWVVNGVYVINIIPALAWREPCAVWATLKR